jgi:hypothetical protein
MLKQIKNKIDQHKKLPSYSLDVSLKAPVILIPFSSNNDDNDECWVFHLGDLKVKNYWKECEDEHKGFSNNFYVDLKNVNMQYFMKVKEYEENHLERGFKLIDDFEINLAINL